MLKRFARWILKKETAELKKQLSVSKNKIARLQEIKLPKLAYDEKFDFDEKAKKDGTSMVEWMEAAQGVRTKAWTFLVLYLYNIAESEEQDVSKENETMFYHYQGWKNCCRELIRMETFLSSKVVALTAIKKEGDSKKNPIVEYQS